MPSFLPQVGESVNSKFLTRDITRLTPALCAIQHDSIFTSSWSVQASNKSTSRPVSSEIPASLKTCGLAPLPRITLTSSASSASRALSSSCSTRYTSCCSPASVFAMLRPTSPAPTITIFIQSSSPTRIKTPSASPAFYFYLNLQYYKQKPANFAQPQAPRLKYSTHRPT